MHHLTSECQENSEFLLYQSAGCGNLNLSEVPPYHALSLSILLPLIAAREEFTRERIRVDVSVQCHVKEIAVDNRVKQDKVSCVGFCLDDVAFFSIVLIFPVMDAIFLLFSGKHRKVS